MKISIVGWYGMSNVGDESFRRILPDFFGVSHNIEFVTPPRRPTSPDIVVLGGGAVVSPFYLNVLPDCPRYALGVDIAYESEIDLLANYNFREVLVRNTTDLPAMREKLACHVEAIPDLAFLMRPPLTPALCDGGGPPRPKSIGVFATDYVNPAIDRPVAEFSARSWSFQECMAAELDRLARRGCQIKLMSCATDGYGDDRRINLGIKAFMREPATCYMSSLSPDAMLSEIGHLDGALCMRYHAHVFAMIAGTPFLSIAFTRKVQLLLENHGITGRTVGRFDGDSFRLDSCESLLSGPRDDGFRWLAGTYREQLFGVRDRVRREWLR